MPLTDTTLLPLSDLPALAAAYRKQVEEEEADDRRRRIDDARDMAVDAAHDHIAALFPETCARVLPKEAWIGYWEGEAAEEGKDQDHDAVAVTHLGNGLFLRHVHHWNTEAAPSHEVTLLSPCACGTYREYRVLNDYTFALRLESVEEARSRDVCTSPSCESNRR